MKAVVWKYLLGSYTYTKHALEPLEVLYSEMAICGRHSDQEWKDDPETLSKLLKCKKCVKLIEPYGYVDSED